MTKTQINQLITNNRRLFSQGSVITEKVLCELMGISIPKRFTRRSLDKLKFAKLSAYCQLNRYLSQRGLVIAQRKCGEEYHVLEGDSIERQVIKLKKLASDKERNAVELAKGLLRFQGKWKKLTNAQLKVVRDYQNDILKRM